MPGFDMRSLTSLRPQRSEERLSDWRSKDASVASLSAVQCSDVAGLRTDTRPTTRTPSLAHSYTSASATSPSPPAFPTPPSSFSCAPAPSITASAQAHPVPASPCQRAAGCLQMDQDTVSHDSHQSFAPGHPDSFLCHHANPTAADSRWTEGDGYPDQTRAPITVTREALPPLNNKLARLRAKSAYGGHYMDFAMSDPRGIFCLHSVPCCSGPFDKAGQCSSSSNGGFCSCKLPMVPLIKGVK